MHRQVGPAETRPRVRLREQPSGEPSVSMLRRCAGSTVAAMSISVRNAVVHGMPSTAVMSESGSSSRRTSTGMPANVPASSSDPFASTPNGASRSSRSSSGNESSSSSSSGPSSSKRQPHDSICPAQTGHSWRSQPGWCHPSRATPQSPHLEGFGHHCSRPNATIVVGRPATWNTSTVHVLAVLISSWHHVHTAVSDTSFGNEQGLPRGGVV